MKLKGNNLIISADGAAIAASKSCTVEVSGDTVETSNAASGKWKNFIPSYLSWKVSTTHLVPYTSASDTPIKEMLARVGKTFTLTLSVNDLSSDTVSGSAICTDCKITATRGNLVQGSFTFKGSGSLE